MVSRKGKRDNMIDAFNLTCRHLDVLHNIDISYLFIHCFERVFTLNNWFTENIQLKAIASDTEAAFFDLNLSINNDLVSTKIYDKRGYFDCDIVNCPFLDGDDPQRPSYVVYIYTMRHKLSNFHLIFQMQIGMKMK